MIARLLFLTLCLVAPLNAFAADRVYNTETAMLDNGMQVVVIPIHRTPAVTHMVWYKAGAGEEPWGQSGIAHFMEHLMFKGSALVPEGEFSKRVQRMGGNDNAFTSWDYTAFFQTVPKEKLIDVMRMESDRMNNLTPKIDSVLSEKQVVIEERRQTTDSDPSTLLNERMRNVLFPNHPYGRPVLGWMPEMQTLKWVNALVFYKKWYAPENAVLVISGDTTLAEALPLANETYGKLPREYPPERARPVSPEQPGDVTVTFAREDVRQPVWARMLRVPSAHQDSKQSLALEVLEDLLGGSTGRLYQTLVVKDKIATTIGVNYSPYAWDDATFSFSGAPAAGVSMDKLASAVDGVLKDAASKGFTDKEVKDSIARLQDEAVYARDSLSGPAMEVGYALATGISLEDAETWPTRLESVTPAQVLAVLKEKILNRKGATGWLLPKDKTP